MQEYQPSFELLHLCRWALSNKSGQVKINATGSPRKTEKKTRSSSIRNSYGQISQIVGK